jgi:hypothetical protein
MFFFFLIVSESSFWHLFIVRAKRKHPCLNHICLKIIFHTELSKSDRIYVCYLWFVIFRTRIASARRASDFSATSCLRHLIYIKIYDLQSRKLKSHFDFIHVNFDKFIFIIMNVIVKIWDFEAHAMRMIRA